MDLAPYRTHRRVLAASLVGTAVEFYDFYIYGTAAALVFGPLFFPGESGSAQLMYSFMTFGLAFFARPVGAIVFGHYGDRIGRKSTLVASLMLMAGSSVSAIGREAFRLPASSDGLTPRMLTLSSPEGAELSAKSCKAACNSSVV